ncbi:MAG TPA: efflux RND transporter periplasmic adaptor subunit [Desulfuromonadaceae bacterium]
MKRLVPLAIMAVAASLLGAGCARHHDREQKAAAPVVVRGAVVETVKTVAVPERLEVMGTVRARTSAVVSARIPGTITVLRVREGDRVGKGQVLVQLDAQEKAATAAAAAAGIDEAQRGLDEARARKRLADATFERYRNLFNEQAVTRQEFDTRQTEQELASQGAARAEARLKQAREGSRAATAMADYTRIVAPITGIVSAKPAELGATVFPAQPLLTIEDDGSYQLELAVPESLGARVKPGAMVQVMLDSLNTSISARVAQVVPAADPASRTFTAKVNLDQKGLRSGMFGRGAIDLGTRVNTLLVPGKALMERGSLTSLWVVDLTNIAHLRLVKAGKSIGDRREILSGLSDGERVVVSGAEKIREGVKVE